MNQYKIGQLAKIMGVSSHLLKHYEKFGLVVPIVDDSTNYRYYDISQCSRIIESKKYRNIGFSLSEIAELMNHDSDEEIENKVNDQIQVLETQIRELELQKHMAIEYLYRSKEFNHKLNQWFIESNNDYLFLIQSEQRSLYEEGKCTVDEHSFLDQIPLAKSALFIYQDTFKTNQMHYHWGIAKAMDEKQETLQSQDYYIHYNASRCFCTYLAIESPYIDNNRLITAIKEQYRHLGGDILKDALAIRFKIAHNGEKELHYFKILISLNM